MIKYDWNCETVDVYPTEGELKDVVYNVHWIVTGSDGSVQSSIYGTQILNTSDITNFIPVDQLTNEEIVAWTQSAIGKEQVAQIEENIANQIALLINPTSITINIKK